MDLYLDPSHNQHPKWDDYLRFYSYETMNCAILKE